MNALPDPIVIPTSTEIERDHRVERERTPWSYLRQTIGITLLLLTAAAVAALGGHAIGLPLEQGHEGGDHEDENGPVMCLVGVTVGCVAALPVFEQVVTGLETPYRTLAAQNFFTPAGRAWLMTLDQPPA